MNSVECVVEEIIEKPYPKWGFWCVRVKANSWGNVFETIITFKTEEEANNVSVGYSFES